ncbi:MAG: VOC family protein [Acidimicrobiia bacterium]|nr:VOC family protein [Acidimicrobiia bacterium]MDH3397222.1 VOC family protein [Acidimicrobiia bacterium]MDH5616382.1 VOC family protein [Acidimicrobiia bacterium]
MATSVQIVIDCADPAKLAGFWSTALGYIVQAPPEGFDSWEAFLTDVGVPESEWNSASAVVDPDGGGPRIFFQRVPEKKSVKNRVHLDLNVGGGQSASLDQGRLRVDAEAERLVLAGATVVGPVEERGDYWVVLRDPEGNEFCVQ